MVLLLSIRYASVGKRISNTFINEESMKRKQKHGSAPGKSRGATPLEQATPFSGGAATYYTAHAVDCLKRSVEGLAANGLTYETQNVEYVIKQLLGGVKFRLPDAGDLLGLGSTQLQFAADDLGILRLPYPATVLEYTYAYDKQRLQDAGSARSGRRVTLVLDIPPGAGNASVLESWVAAVPGFYEQGGLIVVPVWSSDHQLDHLRNALGKRINDLEWIVGTSFAMIPRCQMYRDQFPGPVLIVGDLHVATGLLLPSAAEMQLCAFGQTAYEGFVRDVADDVRATLQFLLALSCTNVEAVVATERTCSSKLNRKRRDQGKTPFDIYRELHVVPMQANGKRAPLDDNSSGAVSRLSPRMHLRRGHWRMLGPGRRVWVNNTMVGTSTNGHVHKSYAVGSGSKPQAAQDDAVPDEVT
ncbi:hypothetical protein [Noviherbaspirillum malthae]|uniref:hypothetical protein n=1 Tax=Noviherbaspirillum malthae TaxID=1260987 RepID=UPI00188E503E|nr:hypothetical protein [Noviherbaspirillum malthae]